MTAPHIFAPAYQNVEEIAIADTTEGKLSRPMWSKRKAREMEGASSSSDDNDDGDSDDSDDSGDGPGPLSRETTAFVSLTAKEHAQRRAAGLAPGEAIPSGPFPHKRAGKKGYVLTEVRRELSDVVPPIPHLDERTYIPARYATNAEGLTLKMQHVSVVSTLLHTLLQRGDYVRAGRCWALLLRSGYMARDLRMKGGHLSMDVRAHERWGIGAELLLRSGKPRKQAAGEDDDDLFVDGPQGKGVEGYLDYSPQGFARARTFYERLIVQYPSTQRRRKGAQSTTFYAAMFSCWIYEVQSRYKNPHSSRSPSPSASASPSDSDSDSDTETASTTSTRPTNPQLRDAQQIATRMDDIIDSPPYDKLPELLQMRGMVEMWLADLSADQSTEARDAAMYRAAGFLRRAERMGAVLVGAARDVREKYWDEEEGDEVVVDSDDDEEEEQEAELGAEDNDADEEEDEASDEDEEMEDG
jgi:hypothetical protein